MIYSGNKWKPCTQLVENADGTRHEVEGAFLSRSKELKGGHTHNHKRNAGYRKVWRKKHMRKYFRYFELAKASHENNND